MGRLREHSHGGIIGDREYSQSLSQGYIRVWHIQKLVFWIRTILQIFCIGLFLFFKCRKAQKNSANVGSDWKGAGVVGWVSRPRVDPRVAAADHCCPPQHPRAPFAACWPPHHRVYPRCPQGQPLQGGLVGVGAAISRLMCLDWNRLV